MLPLEALREMCVMFATPCYATGCSSPYTASLFGLAGDLQKVGLESRLELYSESLVTRARNRMNAAFLHHRQFTNLFWIDSDIGFSTTAVLRLLLADRDVVTGVYPIKQFNWPAEGVPAGLTEKTFFDRYARYPFNAINNETDEDGFAEVHVGTTGFMCIKRRVFDVLKDTYPELQYKPDPDDRMDPDCYWRFYDCDVDETNRYLSEDYAFSRLWTKAGGKIYSDVHSKLDHLGQWLFRGDLEANLKARSAPQLTVIAGGTFYA